MDTKLKIRKAGLLAASAAFTLLAGPAYPQDDPKASNAIIDADSLPENKALDRRFREILNRQPEAKEAHDPWGSVRASDVTNVKDDKKKSTTTGTK